MASTSKAGPSKKKQVTENSIAGATEDVEGMDGGGKGGEDGNQDGNQDGVEEGSAEGKDVGTDTAKEPKRPYVAHQDRTAKQRRTYNSK